MSDDNQFSVRHVLVCASMIMRTYVRVVLELLDEISNWALMTEKQRQEIMQELNQRAESLF